MTLFCILIYLLQSKLLKLGIKKKGVRMKILGILGTSKTIFGQVKIMKEFVSINRSKFGFGESRRKKLKQTVLWIFDL
jgi:hypothetical protein